MPILDTLGNHARDRPEAGRLARVRTFGVPDQQHVYARGGMPARG